MISRFQGLDGRRRLVEALRSQTIVEGSESLAEALAASCSLQELTANQTLIEQDAADDDVFLIVSGSVQILVHGRPINIRHAGDHVGEMALIDPKAKRSASVVGAEPTILAKITEPQFTEIAKNHPRLWRLIAVELAERLRQRNDLVSPRNSHPVVFVGSSRESVHVAEQIQLGLQHDPFVVTPWTQGVFGAASFPVEALEAQLKRSDIAVLVLGPDDKIESRGEISNAPRDNVIFELGLFMGGLTHHRTFIVYPHGLALRIPSDLLGLTPITYSLTNPSELKSRIGPVCTQLRERINELGAK